MKRSFILASLLLAGTSAIASDYIAFDYGIGTIKLSNSNGNIDTDGYHISWNRNTEQYIFSAGYAKIYSVSSRLILGDAKYSYDYDIQGFDVGGAYKITLQDKIFFAPWLSYDTSSGKGTLYTKNGTGQKYPLTENSDTDLKARIVFGYNLKNNVDSYVYISYTLDDDLLESKDHDDHNLDLGIKYKINNT
jgi:hypothetical protein